MASGAPWWSGLRTPSHASVSSGKLLQPPARPIPTRSPLATPAGVERAGVEALIREVGSTAHWEFLPGSSQQIKRLTRHLRAVTVELQHAEAKEGKPAQLVGCVLLDGTKDHDAAPAVAAEFPSS